LPFLEERDTMYNQKLIALTCIVFVAGLLVGLTVLRSDLEPSKTIVVEANIVHAYFKVYNITQDSGIASTKMISYVVVLNITNPSDTPLELSYVNIMSTLIDYRRDFKDNSDYYWPPLSSKLVAFSQSGPTSNFDLDALRNNRIQFIATVSLTVAQGKGSGGALIEKQELPLRNISQDEYVYGTTFRQDSYFNFNDEGISISYSSGRFG
jgi:hypothetical protein